MCIAPKIAVRLLKIGAVYGVCMKSIHILSACLILTSYAVAQNTSTVEQAESACGPFSTNFDVKTNKTQHPLAQVEAGKAQVYVIEDWNPADRGRINRPTVRVGMDGKWMGADQGDSYLFFPADPGEHHLCVSWKSGAGSWNNLVAVYGFNAKPDQTYYFRASMPRAAGISFSLILDSLNIDEARLLLAQYPHAMSAVKK